MTYEESRMELVKAQAMGDLERQEAMLVRMIELAPCEEALPWLGDQLAKVTTAIHRREKCKTFGGKVMDWLNGGGR